MEDESAKCLVQFGTWGTLSLHLHSHSTYPSNFTRRVRIAGTLSTNRKRRFAPLNATISSQVVFTDKVGVFTTQRLLKTSLS